MEELERFVAMPASEAKALLEKEGYTVKTQKCSKQKIKTDTELVISARKRGKEVLLIVGDFLIEEL